MFPSLNLGADVNPLSYSYNKKTETSSQTPDWRVSVGISLPLTQGTTVGTSTEIARIGNINKLQVEAKIPEGKIGVLKNGLTAQVSLEAYKDETFPARIFRISPIVDETSRTKEVYFLFDTSDSRINAGMYVRIKLNTVLHKNVISVPSDCVVSSGGKQFVFVLNDDMTVSQREVQTGVTVDVRLEITDGLSAGEKIVVNGMQVLTDGATVRDISVENADKNVEAEK